MRIKLQAFRRWTDITFTLGDDITKITGESGIGKSTIFEAIYWCLYGKIRSVTPKTGGKQRTEVTIEMRYRDIDIQMYRYGMRNVEIIFGNERFTGDIAQAKIDEIFGTHEMFLMASYLRAESAHPLITASPSEKRDLTSLVFPDAGKYDRYKAKVAELRRDAENQAANIKHKVIESSSSISVLEESHSWLKENISMDAPSQLNIREITSNIKTTTQERDLAIKVIATHDSLNAQLSDLPETQDTSSWESTISNLQQQLTQSTVETTTKDRKIEYLSEKINSIILPSNLSFDEALRIFNLCNELLSIAPSISDIDQKIQQVSDEYTKQVGLLVEYEQSLEAIKYNTQLETVLVCPCCNNNLQYMDTLTIYNGDTQQKDVKHLITSGDVRKLNIQVDKLENTKQQLLKSGNDYQNLLFKESSLRDTDIKSHRDMLQTHMHSLKVRESLQKELDMIMSDSRTYITEDERSNIQREIASLNRQISQTNAINYTRESLLKQISDIKTKYVWIANATEHLTHLNTQISELQNTLAAIQQHKEKIRIYKMYSHHKNVLATYQAEVERLEKRIADSHKTDHVLAESYNDYVGEKLKEIEFDVCTLGKIFFDETMNITLTPGRETSTGTIRPSFDINIEYGGTIFEDVKAMSTGERKRLSIILMIVLTKYTDGKFLMLDEAFTSVGIDTRGIILSEISKLNIPIYFTSHDEIPGGYTGELNLNTLSK